MKFKVLAMCLLFVANINANDQTLQTYEVVNDELSTDVPKGKTKIYGVVTKNKTPMSTVKISAVDHLEGAISDSQGNYSFMMDSKKIQLYAFQVYFGEVVTENYDFKSQHAVQIDFYMYEDLQLIIEDKPVIYLYPETEINVEVALNTHGNLDFSYPAYNNGWNITATPDGTIKEGNKEYPYLFWEGCQAGLYFDEEDGDIYGEVVNGENVVSHLESQLDLLGLNAFEKTDFITFWAPRMIGYNQVLVQFFIDEKYDEKIASLNITPTPDAIRRIYMIFSEVKMGDLIEARPIEFPLFERKGFTVIEWGGSEVKLNSKMALAR